MNIKLMRPQFSAALFFLALSVLLIGCEKPENEVGVALLPGEDLLGVTKVDTFTVITYSLEEDSIRTDKLNPAMVGAYEDPVFGLSKASHVTELRLSSSNPDFLPDTLEPADLIIDSLVLSLSFVSDENGKYIYGGSGSQYFEVFEIQDSLSVDSFYYDNKRATTIGDDLVKAGMNLIKPNTRDSVSVGGVNLAPQIRIPLDESFMERVFEASVNGPVTAEEFVSLYKGIKISVDETQQNARKSGMIYFDTFNKNSKITMYYRHILIDTLTFEYDFEISSGTGKFEELSQDFSSAELPLARQLEGDTALGMQDLYIQSMSSTKVLLQLPTIENFGDSTGLAINKAELFIPVKGSINKLLPPSRLFLFPRDEDGRIYLSDDQRDGAIDGTYNIVTNEYRFLITRHVQQIILGQQINNGLELVANMAGNSANRVVLNGPEYPIAANPSDNLKLVVTYTKF